MSNLGRARLCFLNSCNTQYLDSCIDQESGLRRVLQEFKKHNLDLTRLLITGNATKAMKWVEERTKLFNLHAFINFISGFELTNKSYDRLVQNKPLSANNFEKQVDAYCDTFIIDITYSDNELRTRKHMLHTISSAHLTEKHVGNVELVDEKERDKARLHPKSAMGINKRWLPNILVDVLHWMQAKMDVRKYLLPNLHNKNVHDLLSSNLWDPEVFPDEDMAKLAVIAANKGRSIMSLLGIQGNRNKGPKRSLDQCHTPYSTPVTHEPPHKRFKHNPNMPGPSTQAPQGYQRKRGNRGGKKHNKNKNGSSGYNKQHQQHKPKHNKGNKGDSFQKGKKESNK